MRLALSSRRDGPCASNAIPKSKTRQILLGARCQSIFIGSVPTRARLSHPDLPYSSRPSSHQKHPSPIDPPHFISFITTILRTSPSPSSFLIHNIEFITLSGYPLALIACAQNRTAFTTPQLISRSSPPQKYVASKLAPAPNTRIPAHSAPPNRGKTSYSTAPSGTC